MKRFNLLEQGIPSLETIDRINHHTRINSGMDFMNLMLLEC